VASIALAYSSNLLHPGLKYSIQFLLNNIRQKFLQAIEKLVVVNYLNIFKFYFTGGNM
jgi:hypothetical protein